MSEPRSSTTVAYRVRFDEAARMAARGRRCSCATPRMPAWLHSERRGFGREWYAERGLAWVVRGLELTVFESALPTGSTLSATTGSSVSGGSSPDGRRRSSWRTGGRLARCSTDWAMTDHERGARPASRTTSRSLFDVPLDGFEPTARRIPGRRRPMPRPLACDVRLHELDPMGHVNNADLPRLARRGRRGCRRGRGDRPATADAIGSSIGRPGSSRRRPRRDGLADRGDDLALRARPAVARRDPRGGPAGDAGGRLAAAGLSFPAGAGLCGPAPWRGRTGHAHESPQMGPSGYGVASHPARRFGGQDAGGSVPRSARRIAPPPTSVQRERGSHSERMPCRRSRPPEPCLGCLVARPHRGVLGTAGFAATVGRRQIAPDHRHHRGLADSIDATDLVESSGVDDPELRAAFGRLAERISEAWTLATVDPADRRPEPAGPDRTDRGGARSGQPLRPAAVDRPRRPRPLQAGQRRPRPLGRRHGPARVRGDRSRPTSGRSTSSAATAARSSCWSCPRPTPTPRRRWPRSSAGSWPAGRSGLDGRQRR